MSTRGRTFLGLTLPVPAAAWFLLQQGSGGLEYVDCRTPGPPLGPALGAVAILACVAVGWNGWRRLRRETGEARFLPAVIVGMAAIFALACLATTAATLVIPPCAR